LGKAGNIQHSTFNIEWGDGEKLGLDGVSLHHKTRLKAEGLRLKWETPKAQGPRPKAQDPTSNIQHRTPNIQDWGIGADGQGTADLNSFASKVIRLRGHLFSCG
jgi:hypothetical protein